MATRTTVEAKITAINDQGNNTAAEVRDVLTELLDYTENTAGLETFQIFSSNEIISSGQEAKLFFSIKGIKNETANMTILVKPLPNQNPENNNAFTFMIPFNQSQGMFTVANFNLLAGTDGNGIIPLIDDRNFLIYQIPLYGNAVNQGTLVIALARNFNDFTNQLLISVSNLKTGVISTSISMHTQNFDEAVINPTNNSIGNVAAGTRNKTNKSIDAIAFMEDLFAVKFK